MKTILEFILRVALYFLKKYDQERCNQSQSDYDAYDNYDPEKPGV